MSLIPYLKNAKQYLSEIRLTLPHSFALTTTQKVGVNEFNNLFYIFFFQVVILSFSTSIMVVGVLARYFRRKKRVIDPIKFNRNLFISKRSRASGIRSPTVGMSNIL